MAQMQLCAQSVRLNSYAKVEEFEKLTPMEIRSNADCAMYLIQMLLPLQDNQGRPFSQVDYDRVRRELTETYGGVTAYLRSPAKGLWEDAGTINQDEMVMLEVMTESLDRQHWAEYRKELEQRFQQEALVIRASSIDLL